MYAGAEIFSLSTNGTVKVRVYTLSQPEPMILETPNVILLQVVMTVEALFWMVLILTARLMKPVLKFKTMPVLMVGFAAPMRGMFTTGVSLS
jgi:hypothetical protein